MNSDEIDNIDNNIDNDDDIDVENEYESLFYDFNSGGFVLVSKKRHGLLKKVRFFTDKDTKHYIMQTRKITVGDNYLLALPKAYLVYNPRKEYSYYKDGLTSFFNTHSEPFNKPLTIHNYDLDPNILKLLTNLFEDQKGIEYILNWLSKLVKREKNETALLLSGVQGSGKGTFIYLIERLIGSENVGIIENTTLESNFNEELLGKRLLNFNEVNSFNNHQSINNKLKTYITDLHINIYVKNQKPFTAINFASVIITTNSQDAVKIPYDDRRFSIFNSKNKIDLSIVESIHNLDNFVIGRFWSYLFNRDISEWNSRTPLENKTRQQLKLHTATKREYLLEILKDSDECLNIINATFIAEIGEVDKDGGHSHIFHKNNNHINSLLESTAFANSDIFQDIADIYFELHDVDLQLLKSKNLLTSRLAVILFRELVDLKLTTTLIGRFFAGHFDPSATIRFNQKTYKAYKLGEKND